MRLKKGKNKNNLRTAEAQAKFSGSYKKKECALYKNIKDQRDNLY